MREGDWTIPASGRIYVLSNDFCGYGDEVRCVSKDLNILKARAKWEHEELQEWVEHNSHGFHLVAKYEFRINNGPLQKGSYSIVEADLYQ
jgi:hypothetical protein